MSYRECIGHLCLRFDQKPDLNKKDRQVGGDTCRLEEESQKEIILLPLSDAAPLMIPQGVELE